MRTNTEASPSGAVIVNPGEIYRHSTFYRDPETGTLEPKYLIALSLTRGEDIVARLLTSRPHGRRESPPCFHGLPISL